MADHSVCLSPSCKAWVDGDASVCPKCGGPMQGGKKMTARGWVLLVLGLFLALVMGAIMLSLGPSMLDPTDSSFTGTREQARLFLSLFAAVFIFGLMTTINGLYIIVTGRQSKTFTVLTLAITAVLIALTYFILRDAK